MLQNDELDQLVLVQVQVQVLRVLVPVPVPVLVQLEEPVLHLLVELEVVKEKV